MRRKVLALAVVASVVVAAVGIAWALWTANNVIHTSLQISAKPGANIVAASTNDDEVVDKVEWDQGDSGPDPSSAGPLATRYASDIGNCSATLGPAANEASLNITAAYGGYWCDAVFGIQNPGGGALLIVTEVKVGTVTSLANCPTMTPTDLNADTVPDVEACVGKLSDVGAQTPILNTSIGSGQTVNAKLSLHVLDSAAGGATRLFDVVFVGSTQS
jgi:hypothetical protein